MIKAISFNKEACDFSHARLHLEQELINQYKFGCSHMG